MRQTIIPIMGIPNFNGLIIFAEPVDRAIVPRIKLFAIRNALNFDQIVEPSYFNKLIADW